MAIESYNPDAFKALKDVVSSYHFISYSPLRSKQINTEITYFSDKNGYSPADINYNPIKEINMDAIMSEIVT